MKHLGRTYSGLFSQLFHKYCFDLPEGRSDSVYPKTVFLKGKFLKPNVFYKNIRNLDTEATMNLHRNWLPIREIDTKLGIPIPQMCRTLGRGMFASVGNSGLKSPAEMSLRRIEELYIRRQLPCCATRPRIFFEIHNFNFLHEYFLCI